MTARPRFTPLLAAVVVAPLLSSGCSLIDKKAPPPCPPIYILADAGTITRYRPGPGRDLTDVEAEAEITGYQGGCSYDDKGAEVAIQVRIDAKRGPANVGRKTQLSYFIAIPHFYPAPEAKAVFPVTIEFPEPLTSVRFTDEEVVLRIPVRDRDLIDKYEIYLGFQTTPEELEMNRKGKR